MLRSWMCIVAACLLTEIVFAAEPTASEKAIGKAISVLQTERDATKDSVEKARIEAAIRNLEGLLADQEPRPAPLPFEVTQAILKRHFRGKASFNPRSGELVLSYDFSDPAQVSDFDADESAYRVDKKALHINPGKSIKHVARFNRFSASALLTFQGMHGAGIGSSNGTRLETGGNARDSVFLKVAEGSGSHKVVPEIVRSGSISIAVSVGSRKSSVQFGDEVLTGPPARKDELQQVVLHAGSEGAAISNLLITGVPDPQWLKEFLSDR